MSNDTGEMVTKEWRPLASMRRLFREHSHYTLIGTLEYDLVARYVQLLIRLFVSTSPSPAMYIFADKEGVSSYLPIWLSMAFFSAIALIWAVGYNSYRAWFVPRCCDLWDWGADLVRLRDATFANQRSVRAKPASSES